MTLAVGFPWAPSRGNAKRPAHRSGSDLFLAALADTSARTAAGLLEPRRTQIMADPGLAGESAPVVDLGWEGEGARFYE